MIPVGFALWHRQGTHFGLGEAGGEVNRGVAYVTLITTTLLGLLGFLVGGE
jgi:hypothetical protein